MYDKLSNTTSCPVSTFYSAFCNNSFTDTDGWFVSGFTGYPISSCSNTRRIGGFGILGKGAGITK